MNCIYIANLNSSKSLYNILLRFSRSINSGRHKKGRVARKDRKEMKIRYMNSIGEMKKVLPFLNLLNKKYVIRLVLPVRRIDK